MLKTFKLSGKLNNPSIRLNFIQLHQETLCQLDICFFETEREFFEDSLSEFISFLGKGFTQIFGVIFNFLQVVLFSFFYHFGEKICTISIFAVFHQFSNYFIKI